VSNNTAVGNAWELDPTDLAELYEVTVFGFVRAVRYIVPLMAKDGRGSIVLVGSRSARVPVETLAGYASAKAAVEHFARCLASEIEIKGIRVNVIGISADTPLARHHLKLRADITGCTDPTRTLPKVEDNLPVARFLLSPEALFVTGQTIEVRQPLWT
jgi:NAD(P)-dependent dehydrogenase (short-subunit alcohol dehydrogenase family)